MNNLLVLGTASNAGKTFITGFIGKILREKFGVNVCPFKAQNMSNYATVCEHNKEISIAQASQAELIGIKPKADMNPVLLKPLGEGRSQLIVRGLPKKIISSKAYYIEIDELKPEVDNAYSALLQEYEMMVIEGAGSGFELNLKNRDLANQHMMEKEEVNSILVTNIENGGIFASILGSYQLMNPKERTRFKGVIINNFRGNTTLFEDGVKIIESWGIPVLGLIPHINYSLDSEDSLAQMHSYEEKNSDIINIGISKYPRASNINDFEPLIHDPNASVSFITNRTYLDMFDWIVLPGSRAVMDDLRWMKKTGIAQDLRNARVKIYGICGGYQMLHRILNDPLGSESGQGNPDKEAGLALVPGNIEFKEQKVIKRSDYNLFEGINVQGFEMHTGISDNYPLFYDSERVKGSMVHEIFHDDSFRQWWLNYNNKKKVLKWNYQEWKSKVQDSVASMFYEIIDWDRLI